MERAREHWSHNTVERPWYQFVKQGAIASPYLNCDNYAPGKSKWKSRKWAVGEQEETTSELFKCVPTDADGLWKTISFELQII